MKALRILLVPAAVIGLTVGFLAAPEEASARAGASVGPIDGFDRASVAGSYRRHVADNFPISPDWTGSTAGCLAGRTSSDYHAATLESLNWFRRMVGLPPVIEDAEASSAARQTALMMHAANALSHTPGGTWPCHSATGSAGAGASNLTLGVAGARGVVAQIEDPGANNAALGHRRWLLFPRLTSVGIGNTDRAGAVTVIGQFGGRPDGAAWIAWPPPGFVPASTVFDRWSLSFNSSTQADFSAAQVSMTENGRPVAVDLLPTTNGYGDATLGWEPVGITPRRGSDVVYSVTVTNIRIGSSTTSYSYELVAFDSTASPASSGSVATPGAYSCSGQVATIVGTEGPDVLVGTEGPDVIVALGGNDIIEGAGGDDIICAGRGNDTVDGGPGRDTVLGGQGNDILRGGPGDDVLSGQIGKDRVAGNQGSDLLTGGRHRDVLLGNTGVDVCWGHKRGTTSTVNDERRTCERGRT